MARRPEDRFATAAAMCSALDGLDLRNLEGDEPLDAATGAFTFERDDTPTPAPRFTQTERSWIVPAALIVVVAVTLAVIGIAVGGTDVGRSLLDAATGKENRAAGHAVAIAGIAAFDPPPGSAHEHDNQLGAATDGNPATTWETERYDSRKFGGLKDGVGIVLRLDAVTPLDRIELTSPTKAWSVQVYVAEGAGADLGSWGDPVATRDDIDGNVTLALHGARGAAVLVWITDLGDGSVGDGFSTAIAEAKLVSQ
jgi:hypothetical protein